jgi:uncharacterized phage-associated protein
MKLVKYIHPIKSVKKRKSDKYNNGKNFVISKKTATNLQKVILAIIQYLGDITYYKLTKLLYLIDLTALEKLGYTITGEIYLRHQEGPWLPNLKDVILSLNNFEIYSFFKKRIPMIKIGPSPRFDISLKEDEFEVVFQILKKYGNLNNTDVKRITYQTSPMKYILKQENLGENMYNKLIIYKNKTIIDNNLCST